MRYIRKIPRGRGLNEPILHGDHRRPVTRREMLSAGLITGAGAVIMPTLAGLMASGRARADVLDDLAHIGAKDCGITGGAGMVPFICFDLSGGANIAGSNVLMGRQGGQEDFLSTAGYSRLGLPGNMTPNLPNQVDRQFNIAFHADSAFLRGMLRRVQPTTAAFTDGAIIAARSENDTGNNPHNPMYGIAKTGAKGELLTLIGSVSSESGGNSTAPISMIDPTIRPTKVDRASDVTGLVDTGELGTLFPNPADAVAVMESMAVLTHRKHGVVQTLLATDEDIKRFNKCGYVKSAYLAERFTDRSALDPGADPDIVGPNGIWTQAEYNGDGEFRKTAAVMKMVIDGNAGAGTIQMGGFDYHTGERATGELRDLRAGECIGACLEYAARKGQPVMIYVFSDGSLSSSGAIDNSPNGRGKGVWTGDNQATAASLMLVYNPGGVPMREMAAGVPRRQIGWYTADGSVATTSHPGANAVNLLVEEVILNYLALHDRVGDMQVLFKNNGLGANLDNLIAFGPIRSM
ncbi:MAG: hypothetical protein DIU62_008470 [Pseudomonadota bacterium]|jgi:hypothetical protein|nr:MAG: general secretion pathway protein GspF [Pseudomonadota bacterium]